MKKYFEEPALNVIRFEVAEALTADAESAWSNPTDMEPGVGEW
jgi:hypothetical protein